MSEESNVNNIPKSEKKTFSKVFKYLSIFKKTKYLFESIFIVIFSMFKGLFSHDSYTRIFSLFFIISFCMIMVILFNSWNNYFSENLYSKNSYSSKNSDEYSYDNKKMDSPQKGIKNIVASNITNILLEEKEIAFKRATNLKLGMFTLELEKPENERIAIGVTYQGRMQLSIECDLPKTCSFIKRHLIRFRDGIITILTPIKKEDLLSEEGKNLMKERIKKSINNLLIEGTVKHVFILDLQFT